MAGKVWTCNFVLVVRGLPLISEQTKVTFLLMPMPKSIQMCLEEPYDKFHRQVCNHENWKQLNNEAANIGNW